MGKITLTLSIKQRNGSLFLFFMNTALCQWFRRAFLKDFAFQKSFPNQMKVFHLHTFLLLDDKVIHFHAVRVCQ